MKPLVVRKCENMDIEQNPGIKSYKSNYVIKAMPFFATPPSEQFRVTTVAILDVHYSVVVLNLF